MPIVTSGSFSRSIEPFYESEYPRRTSTTPLAQSELLRFSKNRVLAQEEIGMRHVHVRLPGSESGRRASEQASQSSKLKSRAQDRLPAKSDDKNSNVRISTPQPSTSKEERSRGGLEARADRLLLTKYHDHDQRAKVGRFNPYASSDRHTRSITPSNRLTPTRPRNARDEGSSAGGHRVDHSGSSADGMTEDESASGGDQSPEGSDYGDQEANDDRSNHSSNHWEDNVDEDEDAYHGLIPKPEGEAGRPGRGGYNLEQAMGWGRKDYKRLTEAVKKFVEQELDVSQNLGSQPADSLRIVYALALRDFPRLSDFEDNWPLVDLIRSQLKYRRNQKKMIQTKADALLGRRFKDVASNK